MEYKLEKIYDINTEKEPNKILFINTEKNSVLN